MSAKITDAQIKALKQRLKTAESRLHEEIREALLQSDNERYADIAGLVHDSGDESVADLLADRQIALVDRQITELREIEAALQRISMGSYGVCDECDAPIELARLEVQPAALRCTVCQDKFEQRAGKQPARL